MTIQTAPPNNDSQARESVRARRVQSFIQRGWPVVLVLGIIGALFGGYYGLQRSDNYMAQATVFVSLDTAGSGTDINQGAAFIQSQMPSYAELVNTQLVLQPVVEELGFEGGVDALRARVDVVHPPETAILTVSAHAPSGEQAMRIANGVVDELRVAIVEAADPGGDNVIRVDVDVVDEPSTAVDARGEGTEQFVLVLGMAGVLFGLLLLAAAAILDRRLRSEEDVKALTDAPVLTTTGGRRATDTPLGYPSIVQGAVADGGPVTWAVLPAGPETDPHWVARGLAASRSAPGEDVVVLDATGPTMSRATVSTGQPSVEELDRLVGTVATHNSGGWGSTEDEGLTVLTNAQLSEAGWDMRRSDHWEGLSGWAMGRGHSLILVLGAMGASPVAPSLARRADAVFLVARRDRTGLASLGSTIDHLRVAGGRLAAVVVER